MSLAHSILPPSSAARRKACPGSRALEAALPDTSSEAAEEGEAAHWVASERLHCRDIDVGTMAPNGVMVTEEMVDGAEIWADYIVSLGIGELHIEERIDCSIIHPDSWGTCDAWLLVKGTLHVLDYKFGFKSVSPYENWQLLTYAAGIGALLGKKVSKLVLHIVQPRDYSSASRAKSWEVSKSKSKEYGNIMAAYEAAAMAPEAPCIPNPQCKYCKARASCTALQNSALDAIKLSQERVSRVLTPLEKGNELRLLEDSQNRLEARISGLKQEAREDLHQGAYVPHYRLAPINSRRVWKDNLDKIALAAKLENVDIVKGTIQLHTPAEAIKRGMSPEVVHALSEKPSKGFNLEASDMKVAEQLFNN